MRKRSLIPTLALATIPALAACDPGTAVAPPVDVPAFAAAANAAGGAVIVRGERTTFLVHLDADRHRLSVHAPSNLCTVGDFDQADAQFVITPSSISQFIAQLKSDGETVAVYDAGSFAEAGMTGSTGTGGIGNIVDVGTFCAFLEGPQRIAEGTVRRVSTLSNASFSAHWVGTLDGVAGRPVRLTEVYQLGADAHDPADASQFVVHVSRILLSPGS